MESLRRAMRDRDNLVGATCASFLSVWLNRDERGTGTAARVPATEWALAGCLRQGGGREFLGERFGGQHAHGSWGPLNRQSVLGLTLWFIAGRGRLRGLSV